LYEGTDSPNNGGESPKIIMNPPNPKKVVDRTHDISPDSSKLITSVNNFSTSDYLLSQEIQN